MTDARRALGAAGEDRAAEWYRERGYVVVDRNWRCAQGELDLICWRQRDAVLVFCEVKTRRTAAFGSPLEAVTDAKCRRIRRLAAAWLAAGQAPRNRSIRFDVAAVTPAGIEVVTGAF